MSSCMQSTPTRENIIYVSIAPLKYVVEQIADSSVIVEVLVPETTSPESYEPTMQQIRELSKSKAYISIGLIDFEQVLANNIKGIAPNTTYINLSDGVKIVEGTCSHGDKDHKHGIDPHIWLSPKVLRLMGEKVADYMSQINPESALQYQSNLCAYIRSVDSLDKYISTSLDSATQRTFAIGHPSLTYYAADYNLQQIAIEVDGKEPSVKAMRHIIEDLKRKQVKTILFQRQTSDAAAQTIASEIGGHALEFDPMEQDVVRNLYRLTDTLNSILNR